MRFLKDTCERRNPHATKHYHMRFHKAACDNPLSHVNH